MVRRKLGRGVWVLSAALLIIGTGCDRALEQGARLGLIEAASRAVSGTLLTAGTLLLEQFTNVDVQPNG